MEKRTYSFNLASYLLCRGFEGRVYEDELTPRLFYFVFDEDDKIREEVSKYKDGEAVVNLREYTRAYKQLRDRIKNLI